MNVEKWNIDNENLEIQLLLEAIYRRYGYDFRDYACAHIKRRLRHRKEMSGVANYAEMQHRVIHDAMFFRSILLDLSINVTEMFRDPWFYRKFRDTVVPHLKTYPHIKVWHAGCSAGQEVYSMAIVLEEEKMKARTQIYATDFNEDVLSGAKQGIYPLDAVREYSKNYIQSGGRLSFADYYTADDQHAILKKSLREKVLFSAHNLVTDGVFGEMHVVFCRNVLIYFNKELQDRVLQLFYDSLCPGGFLCLGSKESLKFSQLADFFEEVAPQEKIYRKRR